MLALEINFQWSQKLHQQSLSTTTTTKIKDINLELSIRFAITSTFNKVHRRKLYNSGGAGEAGLELGSKENIKESCSLFCIGHYT